MIIDILGDGGVCLCAASKLGCVARGVELDAELVERARRRAAEAGLENGGRVAFERADLFAGGESAEALVAGRPGVVDFATASQMGGHNFLHASAMFAEPSSMEAFLDWAVEKKVSGGCKGVTVVAVAVVAREMTLAKAVAAKTVVTTVSGGGTTGSI